MYPRNFLCEEAKIKQRTPLKRELCEIGEEAIWEFRFTSFFYCNVDFELQHAYLLSIILIHGLFIFFPISEIRYCSKQLVPVGSSDPFALRIFTHVICLSFN